MQWYDWLAGAIFVALITGQLYYWTGRVFLSLFKVWSDKK